MVGRKSHDARVPCRQGNAQGLSLGCLAQIWVWRKVSQSATDLEMLIPAKHTHACRPCAVPVHHPTVLLY